MSSVRVKIAAIGLGNRTCKYLRYLLGNPDLVTLVAVVDIDSSRIRRAQETLSLPECGQYASLDDLLASGEQVDACIIGTPDTCHYEQTVKALKAGWHVLLEKPMGQTPEQCQEIERLSRESGRLVDVCYVLRYHPYFVKLKELTQRPDIGEVISVDHVENVGVDRCVHTFVRGPWNRTEMNTSMFFAKCCHDVDLVLWLAGSDAKTVTSTKGTKIFRQEAAPEASSSRCLDCAVEQSCPYSAVDLYLRRRDWIGGFDALSGESQEGMIRRILADSRYGSCAYRCPENDVVDVHMVRLDMESGVSATITMRSLTENTNRETVIECTNAVIRGDETTIEVCFKNGLAPETYDFSWAKALGFHAEADFHIVRDFIDAIKEGRTHTKTSADSAIRSHIICLSVE